MTPLGALLLGFVGGVGLMYVAFTFDLRISSTMPWFGIRRRERLEDQQTFNRHIRRLQLVVDELDRAGFDAYSVPNVDNPHEQVRALREQRDEARRLLPETQTARDRQRAAIWGRIFLHSYGLLSDAEDSAVKKRIRQWSEQGCGSR